MELIKWNEQRERVFLDRYAKKDHEGNPIESSPQEMWSRVASAIAQDNPQDRSIFEEILNKYQFVPSGRILSGGRTLYNCFVQGFTGYFDGADSRESIMRTISNLVEITSSGGGVGINWSTLRPRDTYIEGVDGKSSGSIAWMRGGDGLADAIRQGGSRTAALMFMLDIWHPDVIEFTRSGSRFKRANYSVNVSDKFIKALEADENWDLIFPDTTSPFYDREWDGDIESWRSKCLPIIIHKTVKAKNLWRAITESAYMTGNPGIGFFDRCNRWSNTHYLHKLVCFNPCLTGEMELLTDKGYQKLEDAVGEINVATIEGGFSRGKVWQSGKKKIVKVRLTNGEILRSTPDHLFMLVNGSECRAEDLKGEQLMPNLNCYEEFDREFIKFGFIQGDGQLNRLNSERHLGIEVNIGAKDKGLMHLFDGDNFTSSERRIYLTGYNEKLLKLGFFPAISSERKFPSTYAEWSPIKKRSFIRGCYSANGSVITHTRIAYKTTSRIFAEQMKATLKDDFCIDSFITTTKATKVAFKNGTYLCREAHEVYIGKYISMKKFFKGIGFELDYKQKRLTEMLVKRSPEVSSVKADGEAMVYDFSEPESNWGVINGYISHNCGEQPLPLNGSCNLGAINLLSCFDSSGIQWDKLRMLIKYAVRFLDKVIDVDVGVKDEITNLQHQIRRVGLGTMGLADILILENIRYGSPASIEYIQHLYEFIRDSAYWASVDLAKEKGYAPGFNVEQILKSQFIQTLPRKLREAISEHGLRNLTLLTSAPTGTTSILAGASSGIEPIFSRSYTRKDATGCSLVEHPLAHMPKMITATEIPVEEHIKVQATIQRYTDSSISKTINLFKDSTVEDVSKAFLLANKLGCKGITVYRSGSIDEEGVLCESCNF